MRGIWRKGDKEEIWPRVVRADAEFIRLRDCGPFREVLDDDGHRLRRGDCVAVCDKTFQLYRQAPYAEFFEFIEPRIPVKPEEAKPYNCAYGRLRHPRETKGMEYNATTEAAKCCDGSNHC